MKTSFAIVAILAAILGVDAAPNTAVTCDGCPPASSTNDIVTREPVPTVNCTAPALSIISSAKTSGGSQDGGMATGTGGIMPTPTSVPGGEVPGAADRMVGGFAGVAVAAMVAAYVL